jgi:hypothetical protein
MFDNRSLANSYVASRGKSFLFVVRQLDTGYARRLGGLKISG